MNIKNLTGVAILLGTFGTAHAATEAELSVIGTIKAPACDVAMLNGGVAAFGNIGRNLLSATTSTAIGNRQVDLTVTCDAETLLAVKVTDNRAVDKPIGNMIVSFVDSTVPASSGSYATTAILGLGKSSTGLPIGGYVMAFGKPVIDSKPANYLGSNITGGVRLTKFHSDVINFDTSNATYFAAHFGGGSSDADTPGMTHVFPIVVAASIDKSGNISGTVDVELDGNATLEVVYL